MVQQGGSGAVLGPLTPPRHPPPPRSPDKNKAFADAQRLPFLLLSDPNGGVLRRTFGVPNGGQCKGRGGRSARRLKRRRPLTTPLPTFTSPRQPLSPLTHILNTPPDLLVLPGRQTFVFDRDGKCVLAFNSQVRRRQRREGRVCSKLLQRPAFQVSGAQSLGRARRPPN